MTLASFRTPMASIRKAVRTTMPFSTPVYEHLTNWHRMRPTPAAVRNLVGAGTPISLDLGGGGPGIPGRICVDITQTCDMYWDLRRGIPFPEGSVSQVYSSHLFEHLTYLHSQELLRECIRVLRPGGTFSIAVPNARMYIEAYLGLREVPSEYFAWAPAFNGTTAIDAVNYIAYMGGEHKYLFDIENLLHILEASGFKDVRAREFDGTVDVAEREYESIYAIGYKR